MCGVFCGLQFHIRKIIAIMSLSLAMVAGPMISFSANNNTLISDVDNHPDVNEVSAFINNFYRWYVPVARSNSDIPAWIAAIRSRPSNFDMRLKNLIKHDYILSQRDSGEISGLDFDPFLNAQDPGALYEAKNIVYHDGLYEAQVYSSYDKNGHNSPDLIAVIKCRQRACVFVNFRYPDKENLIDILTKE